MKLTLILSLVGLQLAWSPVVRADAPPDLKQLLEQPILAAQQTLGESQSFCAARVAPLPQATTADDWLVLAQKIREETLARTVYRGEAARWRDAELRVEWLDT